MAMKNKKTKQNPGHPKKKKEDHLQLTPVCSSHTSLLRTLSSLRAFTTNSHTHTLGRRLLFQSRVLRIWVPRINTKPCPLREEQRSRVTHRKSPDSNHDHRAIENHERRLVVGSFRSETARKLDDTVDASDLDGHSSDGNSC